MSECIKSRTFFVGTVMLLAHVFNAVFVVADYLLIYMYVLISDPSEKKSSSARKVRFNCLMF